MGLVQLHMLPRVSMPWEEFNEKAPRASVALDGVVLGGPKYDETKLHLNLDHHDGVVREATMATCMQAYYAIKAGMMQRFARESTDGKVHIFMNDTDQDSTLSYLLLAHSGEFEGIASNRLVNRLLELTNRLDITAGGFPMKIDDQVVRQRNWLFQPYNELRKTGKLAQASAEILRDNLEAMEGRFGKFMMGQSGEVGSDTRHEILYKSQFGWWLVDEIGGTDAREYLFTQGMDAFLSIVATRPDGARVVTAGRRSRYVQFPLFDLYDDYNKAEGLNRQNGFNGSDIVGGSSRQFGTKLKNEDFIKLTDRRLNMKPE